jgi:hypothetical protein
MVRIWNRKSETTNWGFQTTPETSQDASVLSRLEGGVVLAGPLVVAPGGGVLPAVVPVAARRHVALLDLARVGHAPDVPQLDALVLAVGDQVPPIPLRTEQAFLFRVTGAIVDQQTKHDPGL